jgi:hypothetical protein
VFFRCNTKISALSRLQIDSLDGEWHHELRDHKIVTLSPLLLQINDRIKAEGRKNYSIRFYLHTSENTLSSCPFGGNVDRTEVYSGNSG